MLHLYVPTPVVLAVRVGASTAVEKLALAQDSVLRHNVLPRWLSREQPRGIEFLEAIRHRGQRIHALSFRAQGKVSPGKAERRLVQGVGVLYRLVKSAQRLLVFKRGEPLAAEVH